LQYDLITTFEGPWLGITHRVLGPLTVSFTPTLIIGEVFR